MNEEDLPLDLVCNGCRHDDDHDDDDHDHDDHGDYEGELALGLRLQ